MPRKMRELKASLRKAGFELTLRQLVVCHCYFAGLIAIILEATSPTPAPESIPTLTAKTR
jgi:hypothetical protein